ncbi:MAG: hypothetical protein JNM84_02945 [Planctomycetes bacterium]|nr:hypothetical protein [Planctomycetota bacterium]
MQEPLSHCGPGDGGVPRRGPLATLAFVLLCNAGANAQSVWVVDAAAGPGAQFQDLPAAVLAAADGDILRVRPGTYSPFQLQGKGLRILGEDQASVIVRGAGPIRFSGTSNVQTIWIQDLSFRLVATTNAIDTSLKVEDTLGNVVLQRVRVQPEGTLPAATSSTSPLVLRRCAEVHLLEVHVESSIQRGVGASAGAAAIAVESSTLEIANSTAYGESAAAGSSPVPGGAGISVRGGRLFAFRTVCLGGQGSTGCAATQLPGGDGGAGIEASAGAELEIAGRVQSWQLGVQGGHGGGDCNPFGPYQGNGGPGFALNGAHARCLGLTPVRGGGRIPGVPVVVQGGGTYSQDPLATPALASIVGIPRARGTVYLVLDSAPGAIAFLMLSLDHAITPLPLLDFGPLMLVPSLGNIVGPQPLTLSHWTMLVDLTALWQRNVPLVLQYLSLDGKYLYASNSIALLVPSS